jgi:oxygen-independent coproporphyrinogen-3 oxidase
LQAWERFGTNRYSVGTQSLDERFLKVLDRAHGREETFRLLTALNGKNFSVDFLLGAPRSAEWSRDILQELDELLGYGPSHISLYILNPAGGYKLKAFIPDDEWVGAEYLSVSEHLQERGFNHYEVSNFALPGREARHNLRYWLGENVAALGPTGTGYFSANLQQAWRYKWKPSQAEVEGEALGADELRLEKLYLRLRLNTPFKTADIFAGYETAAEALLNRWAERGLCIFSAGAWRMQPSGWVILDSLMDEVFGTLPLM